MNKEEVKHLKRYINSVIVANTDVRTVENIAAFASFESIINVIRAQAIKRTAEDIIRYIEIRENFKS